MKNWLKICKFTLKQAIKGKKFIGSTVFVGIAFLIIAAVSNILISGALDDKDKASDLKAVYIVNETDLSLDIDSFEQKHQKDYPYLTISEVSGLSAEEAAKDVTALGDNEDTSIVLNIKESEESCDLTIYIPKESTVGSGDAKDFARDFSETIKNAKISSTGVSADKINMAVSDLNINEITINEPSEEEDYSFISYLAPMLVMIVLYFLVIFYGQSIGQIVSMEKTSKLMEYILTLSGPSAIIFGKVTAIFCEAVIQTAVWIVCAVTGLVISNVVITDVIGLSRVDIISVFLDMLPENGVSANFYVLLVLAVIALLCAFLFYCFVSALFASFAATAEELSQTTSMSFMTMLVGFLTSFYVPLFTENDPIGMTIIRIIPFTSAFVLPGDIVSAKIGFIPFVLYLALLLLFTVLLAILTGRVYKNRLFKKGTKGIFAEIAGAITGKVKTKEDGLNEVLESLDSRSSKALIYGNLDNAKKAYTIIGFAILTFMLAANAIGGIIGDVLAKIISAKSHLELTDVYADTTFLALANIVSIYGIACPLCALVAKLSNGSKYVVKGTISKNQYIRAICIMFPVTVLLANFSNYLAALLSGGEAENSMINTLTSGDNILSMIMVSVLAPIFEELIYRKLIIDRTRRYGELTAIIYSALAFGLFHCNIYQFFYAFALGLIFGYVYVRTGNILMTIVMHMIVNSSSAIMAPYMPVVYTYFIYVMIGLGIVSIIYTIIKKDVHLEKAPNEVPHKMLSGAAFKNSGSILFAIVCIYIMAYSLIVSTLLG
ncbi:type II CAAX prenyl endopeptidase Rce1 family protein [Butyrivibrio fibrisolvens]|uniref:CPBP family glutamic-type intramembrane protease n=1 Tax=Butyrivibrio fibrisolvens TaxID=831 RepID=UPI0003B61276|nr:CPBP family glutamic-type intramembrane protease [Butyrivibrio fibrisolvens]